MMIFLTGILGILIFLLTFLLLFPVTVSQVYKHDPDCDYNITQIIKTKGYPCEEHKVTTKDGYILGVFRIPYGRNSTSSLPGRPVLLQHGLLDAATTWVMNFPDQSLAYILADSGYDVWLGNMRGNYYSRAHTKYNPNRDEAFWDFSWDDMARDDLPSMIYYILNVTQQTQIGYVGHSQGTMIAFAEFGHPDSVLQNNVSFYAALAPVAHVGHIKSPIRYLSSTSKELELYWHLLFGRNEFLPSSYIIKWLGTFACGEVILDRLLCENILFILCGPEKKNMNNTRLPVYISHEPDGTSVKNMIHFAQGVQSNIFRAYDYGSPQKNQLHYNQTTPPEYNIHTIKVPTAIFWSGKDWLADAVDIAYIFDNLQSIVYKKYVPDYNHLDFVWALSANKIIYTDLINVMQKYHPPN
jgi:pimeloyl-ACP methyl ester carboxylesterase